ncbi:DivIVA domain-containing protein [Mycoplasmopsis gallinacea]|uniref:Uncharacterized protein n=1 Tax=Mycoplasmopsis gallinacea TaxID=29556 RepID=A0A6H0V0P3_9BACT|nr:DivIVA domain-containing protein [Mycoplasmopsis gallinacea]QIW61911.1 hypothetical protein GOQ20_00265 [Mycoplasmopsis gallinacea]
MKEKEILELALQQLSEISFTKSVNGLSKNEVLSFLESLKEKMELLDSHLEELLEKNEELKEENDKLKNQMQMLNFENKRLKSYTNIKDKNESK